ncbi:PAS domain S-box protein [[Phormidium] sp. LEGE 05292]|uniref:PAS domain S-box protein n=1 Tax=[Phormidium] sp. LEGE 05292 TaxID=767427 RepID=UPI0018822C43|nr:PAS domain S-box protein [Phormidium sp. LEGE 05292]
MINYHPLTITADTTVDVAIALMSQNSTNYLVVLANTEPESPIVGLFTEREIIQLTASGIQLSNLSLDSVISKELITINETATTDLFGVTSLLRKHQINYLPVVGKTGNFIGIITQQSIQDRLLEAINTKEVNQKLTELQNLIEQQARELKILNDKLQNTIHHRNLAEEKVLSSEQKLRRVFAAMTDLLMVINLAEGQVKDVEIFPTNLTNLPNSNELVEYILENLNYCDNNSVNLLSLIQESLMKNQIINFDRQISFFQQEFWFSISISPFSDNSVLWVARDITARKQAEHAWEKSEARFQTLVANIPGAVYEFVINSHDGISLEYISPAIEEIYEFTHEEVLEEPQILFDAFHPDDRQSYEEAVTISRQNLSPFSHEWRIITPSGKLKWVQANSQPERRNNGDIIWYGVLFDVSDRKFAEQALQESKTNLATAQRVAHIGSWQFDVFQRKVTWSEELFHIFGLDPTNPEPTFDEHKQLIYPEDCDVWYQIVTDSLQTGKSYTQIYRIIRPDSEIRYIEGRGEAIFNDAQEVIQLYGTAMDVTERKQAEIALRESEEKFRAIFNQAIQFIGLLQPDGMILEINQTALDFAGIAREDVIDKLFWETKWWTISPETQSELKLAIAAAAAGALMRYEVDVIGKDNQTVTIDFSLRPICNQQGEVTLLIAEGRDISDRKTLEQKLAFREALLNAFFYSAPVGLCIVDEELRYVKINQQLAEINGLPTSEHIGKNFYQILPEVAPSLVPLFQQVLTKDEAALNLEIRGEVPSQPGVLRDWIVSLFPIPGEDGNSRSVGSVVVEVTERKRVEKALRESAKREQALTQVIQKIRQTLELPEIFSATTTELRQLLDCDRVTIYRFHDDCSGEFVSESVADGWISLLEVQQQNPQLTACTLKKEECVIKKLNQHDLENHTANYLAVADIYQSELTNCHIEILEKFQSKAYLTVPIFSGNHFWGLLAVYQNYRPRQWQESEINVVLQIGTQLAVALQQAELLSQTQRQSLELMKAKEVADAANYAKSQFLAKMSHELRTPLNAILGFSQIMVRSNSVSPEQREHLEIINRSGEHLLNLINDILSMAKIESGQVILNESCFNLHQMLELLKDMFQLKAQQKGLELNFIIAPEVPQNIQTDESKLRQILLNLLGNAIKFTDTGYITLTVFLAQLEAQETEAMPIMFTIKDTGPGIAHDEITRLFQPFSQTQTGRQTGQGTGLGLAISQQFIKLMGGEIVVESQLGIGSIFTFNISAKLAPETTTNISLNTRQVISLEPNQPIYRILVVEDIKENRQLLVKLLVPLGFEVREAENGQEAITIWESWQPHLIWMDMRMPVMDGYEATRRIKAHPQGKNTVIIALTASVFEEQQPAILKAGCDDLVPKPFRSEVLLEKIAKYLDLRYIYAENSQSIPDHSQILILTPEELKVMSQEWIGKLHQAAAAVDDQLILELAQEIPETYINLVNILKDLVDNFRLDIIFKITEIYLKDSHNLP